MKIKIKFYGGLPLLPINAKILPGNVVEFTINRNSPQESLKENLLNIYKKLNTCPKEPHFVE